MHVGYQGSESSLFVNEMWRTLTQTPIPNWECSPSPAAQIPEATDSGASHNLCIQGHGQLPGLPCLSEGTAQGLQAQQHSLG